MSDRFNVLFVVYDDLRPELGCYGVDWMRTPVIDGLAAEGVLFERAYCQQAICGPSRASALSGCRPDTTRIYDLNTTVRQAMPDVLTLPEHFRKHGYETSSVGKVYHHADDDLQGWSRGPVRPTGDWLGRGYLTDEAIAAIAECDGRMQAMGSSRRGLGPATERADVADDAYQDGRSALLAVDELRKLKRSGSPFFLALGFLKPHLPFAAPGRYWDCYREKNVPLAVNPFAPEGVTEYSLTNWGELRGYFDMPDEGEMPDETARRLVHGYAACTSYADAQLGLVLNALRTLGLAENTVVMLWGDHGWKLGEHGSWCKHTNFEIGARAPLIVRAPQVKKPGSRSAALVEFVDMYPALCELCGLPVPDHCEGTSLAPLLAEPDRHWKSAAFNQYPRRDVMGRAMRTDRYRYVEWQHRESGEVRARELYDHHADPQENLNAAGRPENSKLLEELSRHLAAGPAGAATPAL